MRKPTMRDVSRLAGVSPMTVSRVLADPTAVAEETRRRVLIAVDQIGYVADRIAGSLSSRRTSFIGVILPTLTNSNFADTAEGLTDAVGGAGFQLLIGYTGYRLSEEERLIGAMLGRRPEAIVVAGTVHSGAATQMLMRSGIPIVEIWAWSDRPVDSVVGFSNYEVGWAAAQYLASLGHRRIAGLGPVQEGELVDSRGEERLRGLAAALREAGLDDGLVLRHGQAPVSFGHGARALGALLERTRDVDAVFAVSDISAVGVLMECRRRGIRVPEDLSLMGFGDFEVGRECAPSVTTVGVDAHAIGRRAGELLLELLDGGQRGPAGRLVDVGFRVIARETTAPVTA